jgi:membrane protein implicated in regulation of membrane protease activity
MHGSKPNLYRDIVCYCWIGDGVRYAFWAQGLVHCIIWCAYHAASFSSYFLYGAVFNLDDAWKFAKALLLLSIPMTVLIAFQFSLPQDHIINIAPGGEGSAGFAGALDKFRPPGTFSFISGLSNFYGLAAAAFAGWITSGPRPLPKWIWLSAVALIFALPLSISRTMLFSYALVVAMTAFVCLLAGKAIKNFLLGFAIVVIIAASLSQTALFNEAQEAFSYRWQDATETEGGHRGVVGVLDARVSGAFKDGFDIAKESPLFGLGIGMGTNIGAKRLSGALDFLIAETEWGLIMGELGFF